MSGNSSEEKNEKDSIFNNPLKALVAIGYVTACGGIEEFKKVVESMPTVDEAAQTKHKKLLERYREQAETPRWESNSIGDSRWEVYVSDEIREAWPALSLEARCVAVSAAEAAHDRALDNRGF